MAADDKGDRRTKLHLLVCINQAVPRGLPEIPRGSGALTLCGHAALLQHAENEGMDAEARPVLSLVCPGCGAAFPSAMQMDPRTFAGIRLSNVLESCTKCSRVSGFSKRDYLFRSPDELRFIPMGGQARRGTGRGTDVPVIQRPPTA